MQATICFWHNANQGSFHMLHVYVLIFQLVSAKMTIEKLSATNEIYSLLM